MSTPTKYVGLNWDTEDGEGRRNLSPRGEVYDAVFWDSGLLSRRYQERLALK